MVTTRLYCSKCRDDLSERIARHKNSSDDFRNIQVIKELRPGVFQCKCNRCSRMWNSRAAEARDIWKLRRV